MLGADLGYYIRYKLAKKGVGLGPFTEEAMAEYIRCCTPENIHAVCEDYPATLTIDFDLDAVDKDKHFVECPLLVLWGRNSHVGRHYPAEQCPDETCNALMTFFAD